MMFLLVLIDVSEVALLEVEKPAGFFGENGVLQTIGTNVVLVAGEDFTKVNTVAEIWNVDAYCFLIFEVVEIVNDLVRLYNVELRRAQLNYRLLSRPGECEES